MLNFWYNENAKDVDVWVGNQKSFQKAVFHNDINGKSLPITHFANGKAYFERMPTHRREAVVLVHNNFIVGKRKKILRFMDFDLWNPIIKKGTITQI